MNLDISQKSQFYHCRSVFRAANTDRTISANKKTNHNLIFFQKEAEETEVEAAGEGEV